MSTAFQPFRSRWALWGPLAVFLGLLAGFGFDASSAEDVESYDCEPASIRLIAEVDTETLRDDGTANLQIRVHGTQAPVQVRLTNRTPGVVAVEGGREQTTASSGGPNNSVQRTLYTHRSGPLDLSYELSENPCPAG